MITVFNIGLIYQLYETLGLFNLFVQLWTLYLGLKNYKMLMILFLC